MFSWQGMVLLIGTLIAVILFTSALTMYFKGEEK